MNQSDKDTILSETRQAITDAQAAIEGAVARIEAGLGMADETFDVSEVETQETRMIHEALVQNSRRQRLHLLALHPSPFFTRCDVEFDDEAGIHTLYFARHSFSEHSIYSWTSAASALRFEEPGPVSYVTPEGEERTGTLTRKDQQMIVDGSLIFLASEGSDYARQLIYQEYLSTRQGAFMLPEIVAQMEKAQDQVIRAHHSGPFVISGPAGSGKTTLALHRIAFLTQSPETMGLYPARSLIVFVQDAGTRDYFSHLLPQLGIHDVRITTFSEWALEMLDIRDGAYADRIGRDERERDAYEYAKSEAIRLGGGLRSFRRGAEHAALETLYRQYMTGDQQKLFASQKADRVFDRYDLTALLSASAGLTGFIRPKEISTRQRNGQMKREIKQVKVEYPLILIDEFQNYLPEQLRVMGLCLTRGGSILYVGDMAQRTRFGTIREWSEIETAIHPGRTAKLEKVYRNTRQILEYIRSLGYSVDIPDGIKEGPAVTERECWNAADEIIQVEELLAAHPGASIGVIALDPDRLTVHAVSFADHPNVRCMSAREAQGVEFEAVCLIDEPPRPFEEGAFEAEARAIAADLRYVALTRASSELRVLTKA